jgi:glycosyltransferase involved in cell wall biosynthesis
MTSIGSIREAMALAKPDVCHLIDPRRLGIKAAEAAERLGVPTLVLDPRSWQPGVDLHDHHPGLRDQTLHDRWARTHSPDGGQLIVGHVGHLEKRKVLNRLATVARLPGVRLVAIGDGHGAEMLRAAGAKVIPHVSSLERATCVATFDVLLQPRKKEVYALSVHEALASGVPVVAFDGGTASVVVRHEHNGLLVDTDRGNKSLTRAVARLAASPDLRFALAANARESVSGHTWDDAVAELMDLHYPAAVRRPTAAIR